MKKILPVKPVPLQLLNVKGDNFFPDGYMLSKKINNAKTRIGYAPETRGHNPAEGRVRYNPVLNYQGFSFYN